MNKPDYHIVSFSGGKDSTAMLLKMIEKNMPIDCILFCDTGLEFPLMYEHIRKVEEYIGRKITVVKSDSTFEYMMLEKPIKRNANSPVVKKYGKDLKGYGWPGPRQRWCTAKLKDSPREKFLRAIKEKYNIIEYVGIAADEGYRLERKNNQKENHRHLLVEWGMTEKDCLNYCYEHGFDWGGLYNYFHRVSCWCCPLQSLTELRKLYHFFPKLWEQLKEWDNKGWRTFRDKYSVNDLEIRFKLEDEFIKSGRPVNNKVFFNTLRECLNGKE